MKNLCILGIISLLLASTLTHARGRRGQPMGEFDNPKMGYDNHGRLRSKMRSARAGKAEVIQQIRLVNRENYVERDEARGVSENLLSEFQQFIDEGKIGVVEAQLGMREKLADLDYDPINDFSATQNYNYFPGLAKIVRDPQEGILSKILMIRAAKESIDFATYIFKTDEMAYLFLYEISQALRRGVNVRLLVDALGSIHPTHGKFKALFAGEMGIRRDRQGKLLCDRDEAGKLIRHPRTKRLVNCKRAKLEVRLFASWFRPLQWLKNIWLSITNIFRSPENKIEKMDFRFSRRLHDKFLAVDGLNEDRAMVLIGGRNISNSYYGLPQVTPDTFEDMEILVKNDPARKSHLVTPCRFALGDPRCKMENAYYSIRRDPRNVAEFQPQCSKQLGNLITSHFEKLFNKNGNVKITPTFRTYPLKQRRIRRARKYLVENPVVYSKFKKMHRTNYLNKDFYSVELDFSHELQNYYRGDTPMHGTLTDENPQVSGNANSIVQHYRKALKTAKKSIKIVSPYLWLPEEEKEWLRNWLNQDPERRLDIISNSILTTDNPFSQALVDYELGPAFHRQNQNSFVQETYAQYKESSHDRLNYGWCNPYNPLNDTRDIERCRNIKNQLPEGIEKRGVARVYGFGQRDSIELPVNKGKKNRKFYGKLHSKYFIIDDTMCMVSSHNFDPRSRYHDTESGFMVYSPEFCKALSNEFEILRERSYVWGSRHWRILRWYPSLKKKTLRLRWLYSLIKELGLDYLI